MCNLDPKGQHSVCAAPLTVRSREKHFVEQVQRQSVKGRVLEPCNVTVTLARSDSTGDVMLEVTKLKLNVSVDVLELVLSLQSSVLDPLVQPSPNKCVPGPCLPGTFCKTLAAILCCTGPLGVLIQRSGMCLYCRCNAKGWRRVSEEGATACWWRSLALGEQLLP